MLPLRKGCCGCSLETATLVALYIVLIPNTLYFIGTFTDTRLKKYSTNDSWYDLIFLTSILSLLNALVSFFALVDVHKKKTSWLTLFILVQIVNCIFSIFSSIEVTRHGTLKVMFADEVNDIMLDYHFSSHEEQRKFRAYLESMYPIFEMTFWVILAISLVLSVYFCMIVYSFVIETKTRLHLPVYAAPVEQGGKHVSVWEETHYYHPPPPPPYNPFVNDAALPPYNASIN